LSIALELNPHTQGTWAHAQASYYGQEMALSNYYPTLSETGQLIAQNTTLHPKRDDQGNTFDNGEVGKTTTYYSNLALSYLLFDFGGREANYRVARAQLASANWTHNRTIQDVLISVIRQYLDYVTNKGLAEARREDLENAQKNLEAAQARFEVAVGTKVDVLQAQSNQIKAQLALEQIEGNVKIALGSLAAAMGLPVTTQLQVPDLPTDLPFHQIAGDLDALVETAKNRRPDLLARQADLIAQMEAVKLARSAGLPTLSFQANSQRWIYNNTALSSQTQNSIALTLEIPIFQGFFFENQTRQAEALAQRAYADWMDAETLALVDVLTFYNDLIVAKDQVKSASEFLKYAEEAYNLAFFGYQNGVSSFLDLLNAQVNLSQAKAAVIEARSKFLTSMANVAYAVGVME